MTIVGPDKKEVKATNAEVYDLNYAIVKDLSNRSSLCHNGLTYSHSRQYHAQLLYSKCPYSQGTSVGGKNDRARVFFRTFDDFRTSQLDEAWIESSMKFVFPYSYFIQAYWSKKKNWKVVLNEGIERFSSDSKTPIVVSIMSCGLFFVIDIFAFVFCYAISCGFVVFGS